MGVTLQATVPYASSGDQPMATLQATYGDVFAEQFTASTCQTIPVTPRPVPVVAKTPASQTAFPSQAVTWTISYQNTGDVALLGGTVEDILPAGFAFKSATPAPSSVVPLPGGTTRLRWSVGTVAAHSAPASITLNAYAAAGTGSFSNSVTLSGQDASGATYTSPVASAAVGVVAAPFAIGKTVSNPGGCATSCANAGDTLTYTIRPSYNGQDLLANVLISDAIPVNETYVGGSANAGGTFGFTPLAAQDSLDDNNNVDNQLAASPTTVAQGGTVTVTMTLTNRAGGVLTSIVPDPLSATAGSVSCSAPSPATIASLNNNASTTVTYTCTVNSIGETSFTASASESQGYFGTAISNSVLVTPTLNATGQVVTWRMGSNTAASPGADLVAGGGPGVFALQGNNQTAFWRYEILNNTWAAQAATTGNVNQGGALVYDGGGNANGFIYQLQGNNATGFRRYRISTNTWASLAVAPASVRQGGALTFLGGLVYALRGNNTSTFWSYNPGTNAWTTLAPTVVGATTFQIKDGGALATDGTFIYALAGNGNVKNAFLRYDPGANTWSRLANTLANVNQGGALVFQGGALYAFRGGALTFWRYDIAANTWSVRANAPGKVNWGGALTTDGTTIWGLRGDGKNAFWSYDPVTNQWTVRANTLGNVKEGGALAWAPGSGAVNRTNIAIASKSLVTSGDSVVVTMALTSNAAVSGVAATITPQGSSGASAICAPLVQPTSVPANTLTVFTWTCTLTAGTLPGSSVAFQTAATGTTPATTWSAATTNSVLVSPVLSFQTTVNAAPTTFFQVVNTAMLSDSNVLLVGATSNPATTIILRPALSLAKSVSPTGEVAPGDPLVYTLTLRNDGTGPATAVVVTDAVPANTTYVTCTTPQGTCGQAGGTVTWTLGTIPAFTTLTLTFTVNAATGLPAGIYTINNTASASATGIPAFNSNTVTNTLRAAPSLAIVKAQTASPPPDADGNLAPGATITYTMTLHNSGTASATSVVVTDDVPALTTYVGASCTTTVGSCTFAAGPPPHVTFNVGTLGAGATATLAFQVTVDSPSTNGAVVSNAAVVSATGLPPTSSNFVSYPIAAAPVISVVKSASPPSGSQVHGGDVITYTLTVTNTGNANTVTAFVRDAIPANTTYVAGSTTVNGSAVSDTPGSSPTQSPVEANMGVYSLCCSDVDGDGGELRVGAGQTAVVTFQVTVQDVFGNSSVFIQNTAAAGSSETSPVASNTVTHEIVPTLATIGNVSVGEEGVTALLAGLGGDRDALWRLLAGWDPELASSLVDAGRPALIRALRRWLDPDGDGRVAVLRWDTVAEVGTIGFYAERGDGGRWTRLDERLLPAQLESPLGGQYWIADPALHGAGRVRYRLVEQEAWGTQRTYGPWRLEIGVVPREPGAAATRGAAAPGAAVANGDSALIAKGRAAATAWTEWRGLAPGYGARKRLPPPPDPATLAERKAALAAVAPASKVEALWLRTHGTTLEKVPLAALAPLYAGRAPWNPKNFALTGGGSAVRWHYDAASSSVYFVAAANDDLFTGENAYRALSSPQLSAQMPTRSGAGPVAGAGGELVPAHVTLEKDLFAKPDVLRGDPEADYWFWGFLFGGTTFAQMQVPLELPAVVPTSAGATLRIRLQGMTDVLPGNDHHVEAWLDGVELGFVEWDGPQPATLTVTLDAAQLAAVHSSAVPLVLASQNAATVQWLDEIEVDYVRALAADDGALLVRALPAGIHTVTGFPSASVRVVEAPGTAAATWRDDVTVAPDGAGGYQVTLVAPTTADYLLVDDSRAPAPRVEVDQPSSLHDKNNAADYLIVAPRALQQTAQALQELRAQRFRRVQIAWLDDVFDEFSAGRTDPHALAAFLAHAAASWRQPPVHVVLVGLGTLDHKDRLGYGESQLPVLMAATPWGLVATDQRFAQVGGTVYSLGRIPAATEAAGLAYVDKLRGFESAPPPAPTQALLVADDPDPGGDFHAGTDALRAILQTAGAATRSLYHCTSPADLGNPAVPCAAVRTELTKSSSWNVDLVSYEGHGALQQLGGSSELFLVADGVFYPDDVAQLANTRLPVFAALTCSVGGDAYPGLRSLAGKLVTHGGGGAIAAVAPSGLSLDADAHRVGLTALDELARHVSVGEALRDAVRANAGHVQPFMLQIYSVTGDPAVELP
ncbi:MAG TPA: C25 family cysteine peptidase [Thermoanaerobaculia bacterium]|nr:C25 family cysteine peptidase [Thermoanaerobaculia bacterium]